MSAIDELTIYLKSASETHYYKAIAKLISNRINEIDNSVPTLLNKAFNHRYTISRIEKAKKEGREGLFGKEPDYDAQLEDQYRLINGIQQKIRDLKSEFSHLNKALEAIYLLKNYHLEIIPKAEEIDTNNSGAVTKPDSLKYLFNTKYEQKLINNYKAGLVKEGLEPWGIKSLDEIKI